MQRNHQEVGQDKFFPVDQHERTDQTTTSSVKMERLSWLTHTILDPVSFIAFIAFCILIDWNTGQEWSSRYRVTDFTPPLFFISLYILFPFALLTVPRGFMLIFSTSKNYSPKTVVLDMPLGMFLYYFFSVKYFIFETFTVDIGLVQKVLKNSVTIGTSVLTKNVEFFHSGNTKRKIFMSTNLWLFFPNELKQREGRSTDKNINTL